MMATLAADESVETRREALQPGSGDGRSRDKPSAIDATAPAGAVAGGPSDDVGALELALVRRVQQGDTTAFDRLVERYQHRIAAVLSQYVRDPGELEDIAQEAFLKAYRAIDRFRGESSFYTWLYRIAVNTAKNHLDALGRRINRDGVDPGEAERYPDGAWLRDTDTPEAAARCGELRGAIERTLAELPAHLREALLLRESEGLSYQAIAEAIGCPMGTVRSRIARARSLIDAAAGDVVEPSELSSQRLRSAL